MAPQIIMAVFLGLLAIAGILRHGKPVEAPLNGYLSAGLAVAQALVLGWGGFWS